MVNLLEARKSSTWILKAQRRKVDNQTMESWKNVQRGLNTFYLLHPEEIHLKWNSVSQQKWWFAVPRRCPKHGQRLHGNLCYQETERRRRRGGMNLHRFRQVFCMIFMIKNRNIRVPKSAKHLTLERRHLRPTIHFVRRWILTLTTEINGQK